MRLSNIIFPLFLIACNSPDLRGATVQVGSDVDFDAVIVAVDGLNKATNGDINLQIGLCKSGDNCISINFSRTNESRYGLTDRAAPWENSTMIDVWPAGNQSGTIAHELLHAVGIQGHNEGPYIEGDLLNSCNTMFERRFFGPETAAKYNDRFDTDIKGQTREQEGVVVFPGFIAFAGEDNVKCEE